MSERNKRVQARWDELTRIGKHGHYETLFQVVREEIELARRPRPPGEPQEDSALTPRDEPSDEHSTYVPIKTPPALVEWKRIVNDAYLLLADPRVDAVWQVSVNQWLARAVSIAERTHAPMRSGEAQNKSVALALPAEAVEAARHLRDHLLAVDLPWSAGEEEIEIVCTALLALASPQESKP